MDFNTNFITSIHIQQSTRGLRMSVASCMTKKMSEFYTMKDTHRWLHFRANILVIRQLIASKLNAILSYTPVRDGR